MEGGDVELGEVEGGDVEVDEREMRLGRRRYTY